jgi:enoyl-CoA hydratase/carnithine racemase
MSDLIVLERHNQVATVILNRPQQRNAINLDMWQQLRQLAPTLDADPDVRVVVFRGAGEVAFSAGADIAEFESARNNAVRARAYADAMDGATDAIAAIGKPTISLIRGFCVGGGLELTTATDLRIAADDARFGVPIARLGILVGYKEMRRLVVLVGPGPTMDLLLTARLIDSAAALHIGLVSEVVPVTEVEHHTYDLAEQLAGLAPLSARWHKQILQTVVTNPGLTGLSPEQEALPFACFDTTDFQEGRRAFLEKRKPQFKGD